MAFEPFQFTPYTNYNALTAGLTALGNGIGDYFQNASDARFAKTLSDFNGDYNAAAKAAFAQGKYDEGMQFLKLGAANKEAFGLTPVFGSDGRAYQLSNRGGTSEITLPGGGVPLDTVEYVRTPQGVYPRRRHGGAAPTTDANGIPLTSPTADTVTTPSDGSEPPAPTDMGMEPPPADYGVGPIPFDYSTPAQQKSTGDTAGKARSALPSAEAMVGRTINLLTDIEKDPNLTNAIGPINSKLPTFKGGTADVEAKIQQGVGNVFTSAYESLRGAQAITDVEGEKATAAIARIENLSQSDPGYKKSLQDAKYEVFNLLNIVRRKAGLPEVPNPFAPKGQQTPVPNTGPVETSPPGAITPRKVKTYSISPNGEVQGDALNVPPVPGAKNGPVTRAPHPYDPVTARLSELIKTGKVAPQVAESAMRQDGYSEAEIRRVLGR